jgi:hypothetical protein
MQITTIGLDIAKNVFQVHGIDAKEKVVVRKQLRRGQVMAFFKAPSPCLIGLEACATAHYWARELAKLGHEVRLMPAKDVKAYVAQAERPGIPRVCRRRIPKDHYERSCDPADDDRGTERVAGSGRRTDAARLGGALPDPADPCAVTSKSRSGRAWRTISARRRPVPTGTVDLVTITA